jgi:hypothetical protein
MDVSKIEIFSEKRRVIMTSNIIDVYDNSFRNTMLDGKISITC